ncbi:NYN domain-containing protein [Janthinobacterium sp. UMAB-56]|uniref:NYN domain-containing protein n=1 Tax=Janthinobacterium sp. UMAB-56 TaxID=1365361 RepID=UPI001C566069|nr:NYN domain-containing protein [Janthinobacterium sp. UMAB-56]
MASSPENLSMAVFCDFENVALGVRDANYEKFDIKPILERLLLKGSIVVKKAYCDWDRYKSFKGTMHEANFELIEIPHVRQSGKNSADIRLVVDALDLCYTKAHVNTFVIISGDSDFSPLVSKLRENAKQVIGVGVKQSTSDLLVANCDEFIFYDDLVRESRRTAAKRDARESPAAAAKRSPDEEMRRKEKYESRKTEAIEMAVETFDALVSERGDSGKIWASMLKEAIKRRKPDFSESYYGFRTFGNLLEEAQTRGLLEFGRDEKSGAYVYRSSALVAVPVAVNADAAREASVSSETGATAEEGNHREGGSRRDSRRNGRGGRKQNEQRRGEAPQPFVPVADAEAVVVEQYVPVSQPEVQHEEVEAVAEVVAEEGNAKRGSRRNGRGGRKNGDGGREARAETVDVAPVVEAMPAPEPVAEVIVEAVAEAKTKAKPRTPARKTAAAKKPARKAADVVLEAAPVVEAVPVPLPVDVAVVVEEQPAKAPRKTPARRPARKKAAEV